jgi:transcriptional regulator with XRE-family HTH domain
MTGEEFRRCRVTLEMTQQQFATALGIGPNTVARYERDELKIYEPVARLAALLAAQPGARCPATPRSRTRTPKGRTKGGATMQKKRTGAVKGGR